jgi:hypothetical protein
MIVTRHLLSANANHPAFGTPPKLGGEPKLKKMALRLLSSPPWIRRSVRTRRTRWFDGAFEYYSKIEITLSTGCWLLTLSFRRGQGEAAVSVLRRRRCQPQVDGGGWQNQSNKHCITYKP